MHRIHARRLNFTSQLPCIEALSLEDSANCSENQYFVDHQKTAQPTPRYRSVCGVFTGFPISGSPSLHLRKFFSELCERKDTSQQLAIIDLCMQSKQPAPAVNYGKSA